MFNKRGLRPVPMNFSMQDGMIDIDNNAGNIDIDFAQNTNQVNQVNNQPMGMFNSSQLAPVGNMGNSTFMNMGFPGQSMSAPISAMSMRPVAQGSIMPNQFMPNNNFEMKNPFQPIMDRHALTGSR